jgi:hypothetical protein
LEYNNFVAMNPLASKKVEAKRVSLTPWKIFLVDDFDIISEG